METPVLLNHKEEFDSDETVYCRILHLSDLHLSRMSLNNDGFDSFCYGTNAQDTSIDESVTDVGEILKKYGLRGYLKKNPVDCIVITGDFTNRGDFSKNTIQHIKEKIIALYQICATAGDWQYREKNGTAPSQ